MAFFGLIKGKRISHGDMILLTTSLSYMLSAGLTMRDGVDIIMKDPGTKVNKDALQVLKDGFDEGLVLSEVLKDHQDVFGMGLWQQIDAAERTGKVPQALLRIAEQLKSNQGIQSKIRGALAYPILVLVVAAIAAVYLFTHTIPEMGMMMEDIGGEMPALTVMMMGIANLMIHYGWLMLLVLIGLIVLVQRMLTTTFRLQWHHFIVRAPLSGKISVNLNFARLYMMINDMVANGSHMVDALRVAASTLDNMFVSEEIRACADAMEREGFGVVDALQTSTAMPGDDKLMLGVGSRTGREMEILQDLAKRRAAAADQSVNTLMELMTPLIMLLVCVVVAVLVISIYLPMLTMASSISV